MWHNLIQDSIWTLRLANFTISHSLIICQDYAPPETFNSNSHPFITNVILPVPLYYVFHNTFPLAFRRYLISSIPHFIQDYYIAQLQAALATLYFMDTEFHRVSWTLYFMFQSHSQTPWGCVIWCYRFWLSPMPWIMWLIRQILQFYSLNSSSKPITSMNPTILLYARSQLMGPPLTPKSTVISSTTKYSQFYLLNFYQTFSPSPHHLHNLF